MVFILNFTNGEMLKTSGFQLTQAKPTPVKAVIARIKRLLLDRAIKSTFQTILFT